ncbi:hypothetical protein E2I00_013707 [Balaenoptera physalus]|uniref:Uncharacterized protein n=1 Tax=Balaenoptera physalus TaxID=9770 RepID=A0A6A1Q1N2_BALPH|nr:hypothetical protein E2I00_013707 [Balaenoptera physalus]
MRLSLSLGCPPPTPLLGCLVVNEWLLRESDSSKSKGRPVLGESHGGLYWLLSVVNDYLSGQLKLHLGQALEIIRGCQGLNVVGCDLVEVSPPYDPSGE